MSYELVTVSACCAPHGVGIIVVTCTMYNEIPYLQPLKVGRAHACHTVYGTLLWYLHVQRITLVCACTAHCSVQIATMIKFRMSHLIPSV